MATITTDLYGAVKRLQEGKLVAIPTETVYGLAVDACNDAAVAQIFALKGRPSFNPLIVHVPDISVALNYVQWNDIAAQLAGTFWPGPLTLVLPRLDDCPVSYLASAGGDSLAVRMPSHPITSSLLEAFGGGLAAPSANRSGRISPTSAAHVQAEFPTEDLIILDGGACMVGIESTVVDCTSGDYAIILRPGSITKDMLAETGVWVQSQHDDNGGEFKSPGMLASHYAPNLTVRMNVDAVQADEALLAFGPQPLAGAAKTLNLSEDGDMVEAAANLFAYLRELDQSHFKAIAVMPIPYEAIGIAINDRLARAAAGRG